MTDAIRAAAGVALRIEGPCPGGQVGAAYVAWPDGHRSVLTWRPGTGLAELRDGPLAVIKALRPAGYPAPAAELAVQAGDAVALVWELLPRRAGQPPHGRAAGPGARSQQPPQGRPARQPPRHPPGQAATSPGTGPATACTSHCASTTPAPGHSTAGSPPSGPATPINSPAMTPSTATTSPRNILASRGRLTGVIDWDGAGRGDRRFDLVTLRFGIHAITADPAATRHLDQQLDDIPAHLLAPMWAHMSLRMTDWAIRHFTPCRVDHWLDLAEQRAHRIHLTS